MRLPAAQPQGRCQKCSPESHTRKTPTGSETVGAHGWAHGTSITPLILVKACCSGSARPGRRLRRGLRLGRALRRPHDDLAVGRARVQLLAARTMVRHRNSATWAPRAALLLPPGAPAQPMGASTARRTEAQNEGRRPSAGGQARGCGRQTCRRPSCPPRTARAGRPSRRGELGKGGAAGRGRCGGRARACRLGW